MSNIIERSLSLRIEDDSKNETDIYTIGRDNFLPLALYLWFSYPYDLPEKRILMLVMPQFSANQVKKITKISKKEMQSLNEQLTKNLSHQTDFKLRLLHSEFIELVLMYTSLYDTGISDGLPQVPNKTYIETKKEVAVHEIYEQIKVKLAYVLEQYKNMLSYEGTILQNYELPLNGFKPIVAEKYYGF